MTDQPIRSLSDPATVGDLRDLMLILGPLVLRTGLVGKAVLLDDAAERLFKLITDAEALAQNEKETN